jgi:outer membrane biosynthesis protein TonB
MDIPGGVEQIVGAYQPTTPSVNTPAPTTPEPTTTPETIPKSTNQPTTPSVNTPAPTTPEPTTTPETIPKSTNIKPVNSQNLQLTKVVLIALTIMLILSAIFVVFKKLHKSKPILDSPGDDKVNTLYDRSLLSMSQQLKPDGQIEVGGGVEGGIQEPKDEPTHDLTKR